LDANVIADTTYVLENLSKSNVKSYYRRALSYKNFSQYKEALSDLQKILEIEPKNKDAIKEEKVVKKLFEDELYKQFQKKNKDKKVVEEVKAKPAAPTNEEKKSKPKIEEITEPIITSGETKAPEPVKRVKIDSETIDKAAKIASKEIGKDKIRIPNTSYGFEADVNSLKKDEESLYNYISNIPPSTYSKIYKNIDIQADYLVMILKVLNKFETDMDRLLNVLYHFSMSQNITMTMMFFNDAERKLPAPRSPTRTSCCRRPGR